MTRWTEADLRRLQRDCAAPNQAKTDEVPFLPGEAVVIELPMVPSSNHLFLTLAGNKGRAKTAEYRAWIKEAGTRLALQRPPCVKGRVRLLIEVSEHEVPASADVANREKAATDLLVSMGVIEGDSKRYVREITLRWADITGIRITIWPEEINENRGITIA